MKNHLEQTPKIEEMRWIRMKSNPSTRAAIVELVKFHQRNRKHSGKTPEVFALELIQAINTFNSTLAGDWSFEGSAEEVIFRSLLCEYVEALSYAEIKEVFSRRDLFYTARDPFTHLSPAKFFDDMYKGDDYKLVSAQEVNQSIPKLSERKAYFENVRQNYADRHEVFGLLK